MSFQVAVFDNNFIRKLTRIGHRDLYDRVIGDLETRDFLSYTNTELIVTPGGSLEFLGMKVPLLNLKPEVLSPHFGRMRSNLKDYVLLNKERYSLLRKYEREVHLTGLLSKSSLSVKIGEQMEYVEPTLKGMVSGLLKPNLLGSSGRQTLVNRVALDRLMLLKYPADIEDAIFPSYLSDLHQAHGFKIGYSSPRGLEFLWKKFEQDIRAQDTDGRITKLERDLDLEEISKHFSFKTKGDFVDAEALHYSITGRFSNGVLKPILFCTCDPTDTLLVRLFIFKWIYFNSFKFVVGADASPCVCQGVVVVYDEDLRINNIIDVSKIDVSNDFIGSRRLSEWLSEMKSLFKAEETQPAN